MSDDEVVGWASVEQELIMSQQSSDSTVDHADALHETTASEDGDGMSFCLGLLRPPAGQAWWAKRLQDATQHLHDRGRPDAQMRSILLLSACSGSCAEAAVLKDTGQGCVGQVLEDWKIHFATK